MDKYIYNKNINIKCSAPNTSLEYVVSWYIDIRRYTGHINLFFVSVCFRPFICRLEEHDNYKVSLERDIIYCLNVQYLYIIGDYILFYSITFIFIDRRYFDILEL